jgi:hypothetical protein
MNELKYISLVSQLAERFPDLKWDLKKIFKKEENFITVFNNGKFVKLIFYHHLEVDSDFIIYAPVNIKIDNKLYKFSIWLLSCKCSEEILVRVTLETKTGWERTCYIWGGTKIDVFISIEEWLLNSNELVSKLLKQNDIRF